jgi:STE24 endopeptidase
MNLSHLMSITFAFALVLNTLAKLWLLTRQVQHVAQHRAQVPAAFANSIDLPSHQKAADYTLAKSRLAWYDLALDALLLLAWTLMGGLAWLDQLLLQLMGPGLWQQMALMASFFLIGGLINLPMSWYQTFVLEQQFGFNRMTLSLWCSDLVKVAVVGTLLGLPILALVLWLMQVGGHLWWFYAWACLSLYQLFVMWIAPNLIMPLFNKFTPLDDPSLEARVSTLMQRAGFTANGFFVMDGSLRSAHSNAYFTGFGSHKRVVFYDTLLKQLTADEMEAVLAHELGHFKHKHVAQMIALQTLQSLLGFALLGWLIQQSWFFTGLGVQPHMNDTNQALALLLFLMVLPVALFFLSPLSALHSRRCEFQADSFAVQLSSGQHLASALLKLYQDNATTLTPDPWYVAFYHSHPPAAQRLARMAT